MTKQRVQISLSVAMRLVLLVLVLLTASLPTLADSFLVTGSLLFPIYSTPTPTVEGFEGDEIFSASYEFDSISRDVLPGSMQITMSGPALASLLPDDPFLLNYPTWRNSDGYIVQFDFGDFDSSNGTGAFTKGYPLPGNVADVFIVIPQGRFGGPIDAPTVTAVPEPDTASLLILTALSALLIRSDVKRFYS